MNRALVFSAACLGLIGALWLILFLVFTDTTVRRALGLSAVVAFIVQVASFLVVREMARRKNVMAGWGLGVLVRFLALAIFALLVVPRLGLPLGSSLIGLATFLFLTTLIEPLFLKT